jgi:hypothetical protein
LRIREAIILHSVLYAPKMAAFTSHRTSRQAPIVVASEVAFGIGEGIIILAHHWKQPRKVRRRERGEASDLEPNIDVGERDAIRNMLKENGRFEGVSFELYTLMKDHISAPTWLQLVG